MIRKIIPIFALLFMALAPVSYAHELIPKQIQEYFERNPSASIDEVRLFLESQGDNISGQFKSNADIERILNRKTSSLDLILDFIKAGISHILSGPDHILFVLSLLLVFVSWREVLKVTGVFTVAHSITIILAGSGIMTLSSKIVEPLIALSIAYVAIVSVFFRNNTLFSGQRNKFIAVFFFGLFHGLGFAGLLEEIHIPSNQFIASLLSFNIGIEIGQILVVAFALPLIVSIYKMSNKDFILKIIAVSIACAGVFWAIQRIVF